MNEAILRDNLVELLRGGQAHLTLDDALRELSPDLRAKRPPGMHAVWELLEHMRIAQEDILRYTVDPAWVSPPWPESYWPDTPATLAEARWEATLTGFRADLQELIALVQDARIDLTATIPHAQAKHTYLREVLLVADHNAYHLGQIVDVRRALGAWPS